MPNLNGLEYITCPNSTETFIRVFQHATEPNLTWSDLLEALLQQILSDRLKLPK